MARRPTSIAIATDGISVSSDGPIEALEAVQRDAFEVRLPIPTDEEARAAGRVLAEWLRNLKRAG
jgi:hypothetical protein